MSFMEMRPQRNSKKIRLVKSFEQTGSVTHNKKGIVGRKKSVRMFENTERAGSAYTKPEQTCQMAISTDGFKTHIDFNHCSVVLKKCFLTKFRCNNP